MHGTLQQLAIAVALLTACHDDDRRHRAAGSSSGVVELAKVTPNPALDDGQWALPAKDHANTRFTTLDQINADNVGGLKVAWTFSTGLVRGHEASPLVVGDTMYVITPFPNRLHALDLKNHGALKWTYDPNPDPAAQGVACCDVVNRGGTYASGTIYYATLDTHVVAVDAATGQERWKTRLGDINVGETITMAPVVVKNKVLVGNSGGEMGVRGWITALDAATGDQVWRAYSTGPDADVLIGPDFKPHYAQDRGKDLGVHTWPPEKWRNGGGTVWGWISYDPTLDLVFHGTANPGPWNGEMRKGDNKWTAGVFARRPDTGAAVWFYQWSPHDVWDHDGINENVVVDLTVDGAPRQVILHAERNGYIYVLDRATGEVLSADPFAHITTSTGVDLETGRLQVIAEKEPRVGRVVRDVCPFAPGAKDWSPTAWSPETGLFYVPHNNMCMDFETTEVGYIAGTPYVGANAVYYPGPGGHRGELIGWDPIGRKRGWTITESFPIWSGVLATGGDLVFFGTLDGWFKAVDARTGEEKWKFKVGSGVVSPPMSFLGPDGKQYVAVVSGVGGWAGVVVSAELDTRDPTAALGMVGGMADLPKHTTRGGTVYVFSL